MTEQPPVLRHWRPLCAGEPMRQGDMWHRPGVDDWWPITVSRYGIRWNPDTHWITIRPEEIE